VVAATIVVFRKTENRQEINNAPATDDSSKGLLIAKGKLLQ
jgi:hypothetical protein